MVGGSKSRRPWYVRGIVFHLNMPYEDWDTFTWRPMVNWPIFAPRAMGIVCQTATRTGTLKSRLHVKRCLS